MKKISNLRRKTALALCLISGLSAGYAQEIETGKTYTILSAANEHHALFADNASLDTDSKVLLWTNTEVPAQSWTVEENANGTLYLRNTYSGLYFTPVTGSIVQKATTSRVTGIHLEAVSGRDGYYKIKNFSKSMELRATGTDDGSIVQMSGVVSDSTNHLWRFVEVEARSAFSSIRDAIVNSWFDYYYLDEGSSGARMGTKKSEWMEAEMLETVLDAYETTGLEVYRSRFVDLFKYYQSEYKSPWTWNLYNDDVTWPAIVAVRGYLLCGLRDYLSLAKLNFDLMYSRALQEQGTLRWKNDDPQYENGSNSCINGPAAVCACYLADATGDESYYEKARNIYERQRRFLFDSNTGHVYDHFYWIDDKPANINYNAFTYNQGSFLGAAVMLYNHYGDEMYRRDADRAVAYTMEHMCDSHGIIKVCQDATGDRTGFKGIFMRYMRRYITDMNHPEYVAWMEKNACHAFNNRNSKGIVCSAWLTKTREDFKYGDADFTNDAIGAGTAVATAINTPRSAESLSSKDAFAPIEAICFDGISNILTDHAGTGTITGTIPNSHVLYRRVDFGNRIARQISIRHTKPTYDDALITVYADKLGGRLLAKVPIAAGNYTWKQTQADILPINGIHDIYLVFTSTGTHSSLNTSITNFVFLGDEGLTHDVTGNGGTLLMNGIGGSADALIDKSLSTSVTDYNSTTVFEYQSTAPVRLMGYSLTSGDQGNEPAGWTLEGSADGKNWAMIDSRQGQVFGEPCTTLRYDISTDADYSRFRLTANRDLAAENITLAEWQLSGRCISSYDITADGGLLTGDEALTDKDAQTTAPLTTASYQARGRYLPRCFSVTATTDTAFPDPSDLLLEGSDNGRTWTTIGSASQIRFSYRGETQFFAVDTSKPYSYYRISTSTEQAHIAEWQVLGKLYAPLYNDLTMGGGTLTASSGASEDELRALADNDLHTGITLPTEQGSAWVQYELQPSFTLAGISVAAGYDGKSPTAVTVYGSDDGVTWSAWESHALTFSTMGDVQAIALSPVRTAAYVRLLFSGNTPELVLGEIELHGSHLSSHSIMTGQGTLTGEWEGLNESENYLQLADLSVDTKYCYRFYSSIWVSYQATADTKVNGYSITSGNDYPSRDPQEWTLEGSTDGILWTPLDHREEQVFPYRKATQFYWFDNYRAYRYYRLTITQDNGDTQRIGQFSEWQLLYNEEVITPTIIQPVERQKPAVGCQGNRLYVEMAQPGMAAVYTPQGHLCRLFSLPTGQSWHELGDCPHGLLIIKIDAGDTVLTRKIIH